MGIGNWLRQRRKVRGTLQGCPDVPTFEQLEPRLLLSADPLDNLLTPPPTDQQDQQVVEVDIGEVPSGEWQVASNDRPDSGPIGQSDSPNVGQSNSLSVSQIEATASLNVIQQNEMESSPADAVEESTSFHPSPFSLHTSDLSLTQIRGPPTEIVFIDSSLNLGFQPENADDSSVVVEVLSAGSDGIPQITECLSGHTDLSAIHIISHGVPGQIAIGTGALNLVSLDTYSDTLGIWGEALTLEGDILFYGCAVAQTDAGLRLVHQIAQLTSSDVAASNDDTGTEALGGNWVLEHTTGPIEAGPPFAASDLCEFNGLLAGETELSLDGSSNLVITDINGGTTNDTLTIQSDASNSQFIINDPNNMLTTSVVGATGDETNTVFVPFSSVTGPQIIIDTLGGEDTVSIDTMLGSFPKKKYTI